MRAALLGAALLMALSCQQPKSGTAGASPPALDRSCEKDSDCRAAPGCCPSPCTSDVINVSALPAARDRLADCPKDQICPSAGPCRTHAYLCVNRRCAISFEGEPAYRAPQP